MPTRPVICFCVEYWPAYMGSDKRIGLFAGLSAKTTNAHVLVFPPLRILAGHSESKAAETSLQRHFGQPPLGARTPQVHYVRIPRILPVLWKRNPIIGYLLTLFICYVNSARIFSRLSAEVVVLAHPSYLCGVLGTLHARAWNRRLVLDYPDPWTELTIETMGWRKSRLRKALLGGIERLSLRAADVVVCASEPIARLARAVRKSAQFVHVIPNGVDLTTFNPERYNGQGADRTGGRVVFVGRIEKWSGLESLVEAAEISVRSRPDIKFVLVGDGLEREGIIKLVNDRGLANSFDIVGFKPPEEIPQILVQSDVAILTLADNPLSNMISPLKLFEYMAMEKPLVVSDTEGVRGIVKDGENGLLVNAKDPNQVSLAILRLVNDDGLAGRMGRRARESVVASHDWTDLANRFLSICLGTRDVDSPRDMV